LAVVAVKITLSIAALMTKVEKRPAKYPSKRIISSARGNYSLSRFGDAGPILSVQPQIYLLPWASEPAEVSANRSPKHVPHALGPRKEMATGRYTSSKSVAPFASVAVCLSVPINGGSRPHAARQPDDEQPRHRVLQHNQPGTLRQHRRRRLLP
jgi:hypothetical protein